MNVVCEQCNIRPCVCPCAVCGKPRNPHSIWAPRHIRISDHDYVKVGKP